MTLNYRDRAVGCFLGLAVGDAVGAPLEFARRDAYPPLVDMVGGGPFSLKAGQWTDDTSMALCLAESILAAKGTIDSVDLMTRFSRWFSHGENSSTGRCFDIGNATRAAIVEFQKTGRDASSAPRDETQAGNGTIMRLAPAVIAGGSDRKLTLKLAELQSRTTHRAETAHRGCVLLAEILFDALCGMDKSGVLKSRHAEGALHAVASGDWSRKTRDEISSSGYVVETLEAALWCIDQSEDFTSAILLAANLADDSDTVAAVTGQIAGALYGVSGIPMKWLDKLAQRQRIESIANEIDDLSVP